jgi:IS1 family transposase
MFPPRQDHIHSTAARIFDVAPEFDILKMCAIFQSLRVRKLTGKPAFLTIADWESETPRIHLTDYEVVLPLVAAESNAFRSQSELDWPEPRIAALICFASPGVNLAAKSIPLAFFMPIFGLPILFFIFLLTKTLDGILLCVNNKCNIKIDMANNLKFEKKVAVVHMLAEGSSIRAVERITGVKLNTIMKLARRVGDACAKIMDAKMRGLACKQIEVDEIWGFIGAKRKIADKVGAYGDVWTFIALDADTKLIPSFVVGKRDTYHARTFMADLASRMSQRVQITSDALKTYPEAVEYGFGSEVDYGQLVKTYGLVNLNKDAASRYSPAEVVSTEKTVISGMPDISRVSTSHVEKQNHTLRMHCRRLTRLTNAFSKKFENFQAAVALNFAYYNFCKIHGAIRCTPAMAAGVEKSIWTVEDLVKACGE